MNNFLYNAEQKIILYRMLEIVYVEKRVNNFLNNAEQKIILCRMLEIVYEKTVNNFYEKTVNSFT